MKREARRKGGGRKRWGRGRGRGEVEGRWGAGDVETTVEMSCDIQSC